MVKDGDYWWYCRVMVNHDGNDGKDGIVGYSWLMMVITGDYWWCYWWLRIVRTLSDGQWWLIMVCDGWLMASGQLIDGWLMINYGSSIWSLIIVSFHHISSWWMLVTDDSWRLMMLHDGHGWIVAVHNASSSCGYGEGIDGQRNQQEMFDLLTAS